MQVNIELRNLRADDKAVIQEAIEEGEDIEIRVRARAVDIDSFGRDVTVHCERPSVTLLDRERGVHRWRGGDGTDEPLRQRRLGSLDEPRRRRSASPRRPIGVIPGADPIRLPPPMMPAWAAEIGEDSLPQLPQGLGWQRVDEEGRPAFRFSEPADGWDSWGA